MTLKQQVHELVEDLPDDSPLLAEVRETLRLNQAIGTAMDDVREGRTYTAEEFTAKVQERWPRKTSAWLAQSERRLREVWDNDADDVFNELLTR